MPELIIRPLQWSALPPFEDVPELDDSDMACLDDVRAVLARHGKLRRFAVHLAHSHFDLAEGEVLIERPDPDGRTQHISVGRLDAEPTARPTTWIFDEIGCSPALVCPIVDGANGKHLGKAVSTDAPSPVTQEEQAVRQKRIDRERAFNESGHPVAGHDRGRNRGRDIEDD